MTNTRSELSRCLYDTMEAIGASERARQVGIEAAASIEIYINVFEQILYGSQKPTCYIFGSSYEGTSTFGLNSDMDILRYVTSHEVLQAPSECPADGQCVVIVRDDNTKAGYSRLQVVVNGEPQTVSARWPKPHEEVDEMGRICFKHFTLSSNLLYTRNGPAYTDPGFPEDYIVPRDFVKAVSCEEIPEFWKDWYTRKREYGWPSQSMLDTMVGHCCFFVAVAHPESQEKNLEWRVSFSLQERALMLSLNPTQHKCYILLKLIKHDIAEHEVGKTLTSYHCKTVLFYTIENNPQQIWTPENLAQCTRLCLEQLLEWLKKGNCPNFFIPEENMFDRLDKQTIQQTKTVLESMLQDGYGFLWSIQCDDLGEKLQKNMVLNNQGDEKVHIQRSPGYELACFKYRLGSTYRVIFYVLDRCVCESVEKTLYLLQVILKQCENIDQLSVYTKEEIKCALNQITSFIHLQIIQCLAAIKPTAMVKGQLPKLESDFKSHYENTKSCSFLSKVLVGLLFQMSTMNVNLDQELMGLLVLLENKIKHSMDEVDGCTGYAVSACGCRSKTKGMYVDGPTTKVVQDKWLSYTEFTQSYTCGCMIFLPCQASIVHKALQYEMFRSVYVENDDKIGELEKLWFRWIVVDSKIFYFFWFWIMAYEGEDIAIKNLEFFIKIDHNLGHKETAYNLLGWIYMFLNKRNEAFKCFVKSLKIRPRHNAAKWHMMCLLHSCFMDNREIPTETVIYRRVPVSSIEK